MALDGFVSERSSRLRHESLFSQAENRKDGFAKGEQIRQRFGYTRLLQLLDLGDKRVNEILGLDTLPPNTDFIQDWLQPTSIARIDPIESVRTISCSIGKTNFEMAGLRVRTQVIDPKSKGRENGLITPTGGGIRIKFVKGTVEDNIVKINNKTETMEEVQSEATALASAMGPKNIGLGFENHLVNVLVQQKASDEIIEKASKYRLGGGGKADIVIALEKNESEYSTIELEGLKAQALYIAGYEWGKAGAIGPYIDRLAGDVGTGGNIAGKPTLEWLLDGYIKSLEDKAKETGEIVDVKFARGILTGKRVGGLEARADATGFGVWSSLLAYTNETNRKLKGESMFVRGCGSAAKRTIIEAFRHGVKVQGIAATSTHGGAVLHSETGFTDKDAEELNHVYMTGGDIAEWAKEKQNLGRDFEIIVESHEDINGNQPKEISSAVDAYFDKFQPQYIVDSATQMTINAQNAEHIPMNAVVAEGGNGVTTPIAAKILEEKNVTTITGVLANSGGVFVSWFEQAQDILGIQFKPELVEAEVKLLMEQNVKASVSLQNLAKESGMNMSLEQAYYAYAIAQGYRQKMEIEAM